MKKNLVYFFSISLHISKKGDEDVTVILTKFFFLYKTIY